MKRRHALRGIVILAAAHLPYSTSRAQSTAKMVFVGILDAGERLNAWDAFRGQLRELGYIEGRNITFIQRYAKGNVEAATTLAKELVQQKVMVIVTAGASAALAAQRATSTIPIVMASGADQVGLGLASSFARPGGNVTGVSTFTPDLMGKRLELLREFVPKITRVAALWHKENSPSMASVRELDGAAAKVNVGFQSFAVANADGFENAFTTMIRQRIEAVIVVNGPLMYVERRKIVALAAQSGLPVMYGQTDYVDAGGLMSYGPSYAELARHAAVYVDKILRGANPGDLPIELPTTFELAINVKTARTLGITVPSTLLARANHVVQ